MTDLHNVLHAALADHVRRWFPELHGADVALRSEPLSIVVAARGHETVVPVDAGIDAPAFERCLFRACARVAWDVHAHEVRDALDRHTRAGYRPSLTDVRGPLEDLGASVLLWERQQDDPSSGLRVRPDDITEIDHLANRVAMDFCDIERRVDADDAEDPTVGADDTLHAYGDTVHVVLRRYIAVRTSAPDVPVGGARGIDAVVVTIGLEALAHHEAFDFLQALWAPPTTKKLSASGSRIVRFDCLDIDLDPGPLVFPGSARDRRRASGNRCFEDLSGTTWKRAREVLDSERAILQELVAASPRGCVLIDLDIDSVDEITLAELGPADLGTCAATAALNAAGCSTITACAGHVTGYPYVAFWTRPDAVPLLIEAATQARIGLGNADNGAAEIFANPDDIMALLRFAEKLVERSAKFGRVRAASRGA